MLIQKGNYSNASFTKTRLRLMIKIKNTHTHNQKVSKKSREELKERKIASLGLKGLENHR